MDSNTELAAELVNVMDRWKSGATDATHLAGLVTLFRKEILTALTQQPAEQIADGALGVTQRDKAAWEIYGPAIYRCEMTGAEALARHAQQARAQGQAEGQAAVLCWLRERGAMKPPGSLWIAAATLADQFEATQTPARALQPHGQGGGE